MRFPGRGRGISTQHRRSRRTAGRVLSVGACARRSESPDPCLKAARPDIEARCVVGILLQHHPVFAELDKTVLGGCCRVLGPPGSRTPRKRSWGKTLRPRLHPEKHRRVSPVFSTQAPRKRNVGADAASSVRTSCAVAGEARARPPVRRAGLGDREARLVEQATARGDPWQLMQRPIPCLS